MSLVISKVFTYDTDAGNYIQAVEAADGQVLEGATRQAINNFVMGCKQDGTWSAIKASCILSGARTLAGALVPLAGTAPTNVNFVSGDYNRKTGLVGNASNKYLSSNRSVNTDPQNSFHLAVYASSASQASFNNLIGARLPGDNNSARSIFLEPGIIVAYANFSGNFNVSQTFASGFAGVGRLTSTNANLRVAFTNIIDTSTSLNPSANSLIMPVFARRTGTSALDGYSNARIAFYSIGESVDLALLDTRVTTMINAFAAAIP